MKTARTARFAATCALFLLPLLAAGALGASSAGAETSRAGSLNEERRILLALNRLGYGPRPGDVEKVRALGVEAWIERQLDPQSIDDSAVDTRLVRLSTLTMAPAELLTAFPPPPLIKAIARRAERSGYLDREELDRLFPELGRTAATTDEKPPPEAPRSARMTSSRPGVGRIGLELSQAKLIRATYSERQLQEVMTDFWFNHFNVFIGKSADRWWTTRYEYETIRPHTLGNFRELLGAVARSPAMLFYLDNWLSSAPAGADQNHQDLMWRYADQAIRQQGMPPGGVSTLILRDRGLDTRDLEAQIARRQSQARKNPNAGRRRSNPTAATRRDGLNENYARELLELHTLGVDGGYTQEDIAEVARCFTGWTLLPLHAAQQFVFVPELHVGGTRRVLGKKVKGKGIDQGEAVLDLLAAHPSTARFISTKLARRFVSDDPPQELIDRMTATFLESDGDIREVLRALFRSDEFWATESWQAKVKTPFEFVVSAARATEAEISALPGPGRAAKGGPPESMTDSKTDTMAEGTTRTAMRSRSGPGLVLVVRELGQPLYGAEPPTGYADTADAWVSTGALLARMKIALGFAANRIPGVHTELPPSLEEVEDVEQLLELLGQRLLGRSPNASTVQAILTQLDRDAAELAALEIPEWILRSAEGRARLATGWLLASSEFQRK